MKKLFIFLSAIMVACSSNDTVKPDLNSRLDKKDHSNKELIYGEKNNSSIFSGEDIFMALYFADNAEILEGIEAMTLEIEDFQNLTENELEIYHNFREALVNELTDKNSDYFTNFKNGIMSNDIETVEEFYLQGINDIKITINNPGFHEEVYGWVVSLVFGLHLIDKTSYSIAQDRNTSFAVVEMDPYLKNMVLQIYNNL